MKIRDVSREVSMDSIRRRTFLELAPSAAGLISTIGCQGTETPSTNPVNSDTLPERYDIIILGGSITGCFAASFAAKNGMRTLLVERRSFLGYDITAKLRVWLNSDGYDTLTPELHDLFFPQGEINEIKASAFLDQKQDSAEIPLFNGSLKKNLLYTVRSSGADVLFMSDPCGILTNDSQETARGVLLATKFGFMLVTGKQIFDFTEKGRCCENPVKQNNDYGFVTEYYDVKPEPESVMALPESLDVINNTIRLHPGKRMDGQYYMEFHFHTDDTTDTGMNARFRAEQIAIYLKEQHPSFANASINQFALEPFSLHPVNSVSLSMKHLSRHTFNEVDYSCRTISELKTQASDSIANHEHVDSGTLSEPLFLKCGQSTIPLSSCSVNEDSIDRNVSHVLPISIPFEKFIDPSNAHEIVIAGAGTGGTMSAIGALERGRDIGVVEYFPEPGGTKTMGNVQGYYRGFKNTLFDREHHEVEAVGNRCSARPYSAPMRILYFRHKMSVPNCAWYPDCLICGTVMDNETVTGLVVSQHGTLSIINASLVIDATGDGDVAVFAGADYEIGDDLMQKTQNYSQWDFNAMEYWKESTSFRDYDIIDNSRLSEMQRGLELSHAQAHFYDFSPMLTVRESRRIKGDYTIDIVDVLENRRYHDTIAMATSDYDPHSFGSPELTRIGYLLPHKVVREVSIPYRSILPGGINNLLMSAKAISQSHNAIQFTRMSADIMTLGYITGRIASDIVAEKISTRRYDPRNNQQQSIQDGLFKESGVLNNGQAIKSNQSDTTREYIARLTAGDNSAFVPVLLSDKNTVIPLLLESFTSTSSLGSGELLIAQSLAWFGNNTGAPVIREQLAALVREEKIKGIDVSYDQDNLYWQINRNIALLGLAGATESLELLIFIAMNTTDGGPPTDQGTPYYNGRLDLRLVPHFHRILNLCFAFERLADNKALECLQHLAIQPYIKNRVTHEPDMAGLNFYSAYLELRIASAAARSGGKDGFEKLSEYLTDCHSLISDYAKKELHVLTQKDFGYAKNDWDTYSASMRFPATPKPLKDTSIEV